MHRCHGGAGTAWARMEGSRRASPGGRRLRRVAHTVCRLLVMLKWGLIERLKLRLPPCQKGTTLSVDLVHRSASTDIDSSGMNLCCKGKIMGIGRDSFSAKITINAKRKIMMMMEKQKQCHIIYILLYCCLNSFTLYNFRQPSKSFCGVQKHSRFYYH